VGRRAGAAVHALAARRQDRGLEEAVELYRSLPKQAKLEPELSSYLEAKLAEAERIVAEPEIVEGEVVEVEEEPVPYLDDGRREPDEFESAEDYLRAYIATSGRTLRDGC
jgi:hypothetical protein